MNEPIGKRQSRYNKIGPDSYALKEAMVVEVHKLIQADLDMIAYPRFDSLASAKSIVVGNGISDEKTCIVTAHNNLLFSSV